MTVIVVGNVDQHQQVYQQLERFATMLEKDDEATRAAEDDGHTVTIGDVTVHEEESATAEELPEAPVINTDNESFVGFHMGVVRPAHYPVHNTRQSAYRYAAWLLKAAEVLPDEEGQEDYRFEDVRAAINTSAESADNASETEQ